MALAVALFAAALVVIATERVDRTKVALIGACLVLLTQTIDQEAAIAAIDWNTLGLLAGMMLMVKVTEPTGVYTWLAIRAGQLSRGRPLAVVLALATTTAVLSAFLDNLTTVLLVVPITFLLADALDIDPIPLVIIEIVVSNIGGTATLIGDPPNILIAGATDLTFVEFIVHLAPVAAITFVVVTAGLYFTFRGRLQAKPEARRRVMELDAARSIEDMDELKRTVPVLVGTILLFFAHQALHIEPATVAMSGATVMLLVSRQSLERSLAGSGLPALPVAGDDGRFCGIFGEREFMGALFPGYLTELKYAGFVPRSLQDALEKRSLCRTDPVSKHMNTEHIDVGADFSDTQVAEIFLHHRVLLVPVVDHGRVTGVITRSDFFRALAERFLAND